jgi:hypothetical protein
MKRFLKESLVREEDINMDKHFQSVFDELCNTTREKGTLGVMSAQLKPSILELSSQYTPITEGCFNVATNILAPNLKDDILNDNEIRLPNQLYSTLYQHEFTVCSSVKVCKELYIRVITKLPNSEQSYKGKVKTHNYINRQNQSTTGKL